MKAKSIKILLSLFVCMFVIPMSPVSALEDERDFDSCRASDFKKR